MHLTEQEAIKLGLIPDPKDEYVPDPDPGPYYPPTRPAQSGQSTGGLAFAGTLVFILGWLVGLTCGLIWR